MPNLVTEFIALALYGPLIVLLHEGGHALFARMGGYRVTSFGVGLGRPLWSLPVSRGVVFHLDKWFFAGGACVAIPTGPPTLRRLWFHGGGLLVQAVLAVLLLLLPGGWLVDRLIQFNLLVALTNAIPWRAGGQASDGWFILDAFMGGRRSATVLTQREGFERMSAQEQAAGSPMGQAYADLCIAWADVLVDRTEDAAWFFLDDPPETAAEPWMDGLYHYVKSEWHRAEERPLAAVHTAQAGRAALEDDTHEAAHGLLAIAEARAYIDLGAPERSQRVLARVAGVGGPIGWQAATILLWAQQGGSTEDLELATWRVARRVNEPLLDPADTVSALWEAGEELARRGRVRAARGARTAATELAARTLDRADIGDRLTLAARMGEPGGQPRRPSLAAPGGES